MLCLEPFRPRHWVCAGHAWILFAGVHYRRCLDRDHPHCDRVLQRFHDLRGYRGQFLYLDVFVLTNDTTGVAVAWRWPAGSLTRGSLRKLFTASHALTEPCAGNVAMCAILDARRSLSFESKKIFTTAKFTARTAHVWNVFSFVTYLLEFFSSFLTADREHRSDDNSTSSSSTRRAKRQIEFEEEKPFFPTHLFFLYSQTS